MHFSQSRSTKCEIFAWNFDFSGTTYHRELETCTVGFGMPWTLNMHNSSHLNVFSHLKSVKCEIFGCLLDSPWKKWKNINLNMEKVLKKALQSTHIGVWVCWSQCTMLELCVTNTFLSYDGFSWFLTGRFRHRILKHGVGVEWDARRTAT